MNEPFPFKRCLLLCGPALLIGLWLRALMLVATPEALLAADTNSYWDSAARLWNDGKFAIPEKRRWLYPLLLMGAPVLPGNTPHAIALGQHALGLLAIVGVGWIAGQLTPWRRSVVPLVTVLFAASPRGLAYEHQIIADSLMTNVFILATAVALPLRGITQRRLAWTLFFCAVVVALKPHGKPLALPVLLGAAYFAGVPWRWHWANWGLSTACVLLFLSSGSSRQSGWLLLSSTLPLVPPSGEPFANYRGALAPVIAEARVLGHAYPWHQYRYKKLLADSDSYEDIAAGQNFAAAGAEWDPLTRRKDEFRQVTTALARSGVRAEPLTWLRFTATKTARGLANPETNLLTTFEPTAFWEEQRVRNEQRWAERQKAIALIYELDRPGFEALVAARTTRSTANPATNFFVNLAARVLWFRDDLLACQVHWTWMGALGLLGLAASLRPSRWANSLPLLGALALSLASSYAIGDAIPRYVYPVEWMLYLFPLLGLAALAETAALCQLKRFARPT